MPGIGEKAKAASPGIPVSPRLPRYSTIARVSINGFEGEAVLRNINEGGFRLESKTYAAITPGERYTMWISPEKSTAISRFELEVEGRWIRSTEHNFNAGFLIVKLPTDRSMERYMDHIKKHGKVEA
ncbi:MAG: PilZ domain-containing protein [Treponema sp.]|jgi:hypothetical protein|nr:PilZ domain-containing protein [Treponema sp.]